MVFSSIILSNDEYLVCNRRVSVMFESRSGKTAQAVRRQIRLQMAFSATARQIKTATWMSGGGAAHKTSAGRSRRNA